MTITQIVLITVLFYIIYYWGKKFAVSKTLNHYTAEETKQKMKSKKIVVLDVRTDSERKSQFINESLHIPVNQLKNRLDELRKYKDTEIICYCHSGVRSLTAAALLQKEGYKSANMKGGIAAWNRISK